MVANMEYGKLETNDLSDVIKAAQDELARRKTEDLAALIDQAQAALDKARIMLMADAPASPKAKPKTGAPVPIKYRDPETGNTWTGRGITPKWLADLVANGHHKDDYLVEPNGGEG